MTVVVMSMTVMVMMVMTMTMMVPSAMGFIIVIAWLAIRVDVARIVIVLGWGHNDHARDTNVNIDRCPRRDGPTTDGQSREHGSDDDASHADLLGDASSTRETRPSMLPSVVADRRSPMPWRGET
jgi:hypothetical protein